MKIGSTVKRRVFPGLREKWIHVLLARVIITVPAMSGAFTFLNLKVSNHNKIVHQKPGFTSFWCPQNNLLIFVDNSAPECWPRPLNTHVIWVQILTNLAKIDISVCSKQNIQSLGKARVKDFDNALLHCSLPRSLRHCSLPSKIFLWIRSAFSSDLKQKDCLWAYASKSTMGSHLFVAFKYY